MGLTGRQLRALIEGHRTVERLEDRRRLLSLRLAFAADAEAFDAALAALDATGDGGSERRKDWLEGWEEA